MSFEYSIKGVFRIKMSQLGFFFFNKVVAAVLVPWIRYKHRQTKDEGQNEETTERGKMVEVIQENNSACFLRHTFSTAMKWKDYIEVIVKPGPRNVVLLDNCFRQNLSWTFIRISFEYCCHVWFVVTVIKKFLIKSK